MTEFITLTKDQAVAVLAEIGELRKQVTELTKNRDFYYERTNEYRNERDRLLEKVRKLELLYTSTQIKEVESS